VADQLTAKDALGAHARDELGISALTEARPVQAAIASALSFTVGAALPLVVAALAPNPGTELPVGIASVVFLGALGWLGAWAGGARPAKPLIRVVFWAQWPWSSPPGSAGCLARWFDAAGRRKALTAGFYPQLLYGSASTPGLPPASCFPQSGRPARYETIPMPFPAVHPALDRALSARGYAEPTPVQLAVVEADQNPDRRNADLLVSAQTGSGKTVAFGLAMASNLLGTADRFERASKPLALVIAPTRELAIQIGREFDCALRRHRREDRAVRRRHECPRRTGSA